MLATHLSIERFPYLHRVLELRFLRKVRVDAHRAEILTIPVRANSDKKDALFALIMISRWAKAHLILRGGNFVRDGFIFYESFRSAMKGLPAETQLRLYHALADYALYDIEPDFSDDGIALGFFTLMRPQIDANNRKRDAGLRGGRPARPTAEESDEYQQGAALKQSENQSETNAKPNDNQAVTMGEPKEKEKAKVKAKANGNGKENAKAFCADKPRRFTKPTVADIAEYCRERGNGVDPQRFFDYNEAKGWRVGNQPMQDWQAAVRTWEGREQAKPHNQAGAYAKKNGKFQIEQNTQTDQDLAHLLADLDGDVNLQHPNHSE